jgi:hypothetical protein
MRVIVTEAPANQTFDNHFTRQFGPVSEGARKKELPYLSEAVQSFIRQSPFLGVYPDARDRSRRATPVERPRLSP